MLSPQDIRQGQNGATVYVIATFSLEQFDHILGRLCNIHFIFMTMFG